MSSDLMAQAAPAGGGQVVGALAQPDEQGQELRSHFSGRATWVAGSGDPVYTVLHKPADGATPRVAALFIGPFGWDELQSHRARRHWALELSRNGMAAARIDLPGTGDSGGSPRDSGIFERWYTAVIDVTRWLRQVSGAERVALIGIGLGGLIAAKALSAGAEADDLILWGVRARGRGMARELAAYAGVVGAQHEPDYRDSAPEGGIDVGGFLITAETRAAIAACDLSALQFPALAGGRALLLGRDGMAVDTALQTALEAAGFEVTTAAGGDYKDMMVDGLETEVLRPKATIARTLQWLADAPAGALEHPQQASSPDNGQSLSSTAQITIGGAGTPVRETLVPLRPGGAGIDAIVSEPAQGPRAPVGVIILTSGTLRKIGPYRMSVDLARRWAAAGVPVVRLDREQVGDGEGPDDHGLQEGAQKAYDLVNTQRVNEVVNVVSELRSRGVSDSFVMFGHCSGAYLAFHAGLTAPEVVAAFGVNQASFVHDEGLFQERQLEDLMARVREGGIIRKLRNGHIGMAQVRQVRDAVAHRIRLIGAESSESKQVTEGAAALDKLHQRGVKVLMLLTTNEKLYSQVFTDEFQQQVSRWPNLSLEELPSDDHMVASLRMQGVVRDRLEQGLRKVLADHGHELA
ncbi:MAG: hypothetical protein J2O48_07530 [Solirubrobacterales bacterium]|nr:hypothetical protein [Solirubrobacterales bacterium]